MAAVFVSSRNRTRKSGNWGAAWAADGASFFCEDMEYLYRQGLDGKTIKQWAIEKLSNGDMTGDTRLDVSPDGKTLLMDIAMNEETERKDWDGPLPAIWTLGRDRPPPMLCRRSFTIPSLRRKREPAR